MYVCVCVNSNYTIGIAQPALLVRCGSETTWLLWDISASPWQLALAKELRSLHIFSVYWPCPMHDQQLCLCIRHPITCILLAMHVYMYIMMQNSGTKTPRALDSNIYALNNCVLMCMCYVYIQDIDRCGSKWMDVMGTLYCVFYLHNTCMYNAFNI